MILVYARIYDTSTFKDIRHKYDTSTGGHQTHTRVPVDIRGTGSEVDGAAGLRLGGQARVLLRAPVHPRQQWLQYLGQVPVCVYT